MPIDSLHPLYDASKSTLTKDANDGDVKKYIPRLVGQTQQEYEDYQNRAVYYNVTKRTNAAFTGALLRKPFITNADVDTIIIYDNVSFGEFLSDTVDNIMLTGRIGMLVDYDEVLQTPYIVSYENESIINWRFEKNKLQMVAIREDELVPKVDDPYEYEMVINYRELYLDEEGLYAVRIHHNVQRGTAEYVEEFVPNSRQERFDTIPFVFVNTKSTTPKVTEPVMFNIAEINISQFKTSADIEHSAHFTALPQPYIAGSLREETTSLPIGTYEVWQLEEGSTAAYLEFSGAGIGALQEISRVKESNMAALGVTVLESRKGVESAEALRIRQGYETSTLINMATSLESGIEQILNFYNQWLRNDTVITFVLSRDFTAIRLSPEELKVLMEAYIAGVISQDTFLSNLYDGELVKDVEIEKSKTSLTVEKV